MRVLALVALALAVLTCADAAVQCLNEAGKAVDWFFVYKQPSGTSYAYYDPHHSSKLTVSKTSFLNMSHGAIPDTLSQVYSAKSSLAYLAWNDEPPKGSAEQNDDAHAKGVLASDGKTGFWLIHSVPAYPDLSLSSYEWTASTIYGQSFLCVSIDAENVEKISKVLQYANIGIFASKMPSGLASSLPETKKLIDDFSVNGKVTDVIESLAGVKFTAFSKSESWGQDLYEDFVSPTLKQSFFWETWRRPPVLPSYCKGSQYDYDELNIQEIDFSGAGGKKFPFTQDHSKWGISQEESSPWVCVGDINRMTSQRQRGGGTVCFVNQSLYKALLAVVSSHDECNKKDLDLVTIEEIVS